MKLQVGEFLIESDSLQFIIKERKVYGTGEDVKTENRGKEYYTNPKYVVKFCDVLKYITDQVLRTNEDMDVILDKLELINKSIKELEKYPVICIKEEKENVENE